MDQVFTRAEGPERGSVVDAVGPNGLGFFSHQSQAELETRYGPLQIISADEAAEIAVQKAISPPVEVSEETFQDALDVLPPLRWFRGGHTESFRICEAISGTVHTALVRVGSRYFQTSQRLSMSHQDLVALVREVFPETGGAQ